MPLASRGIDVRQSGQPLLFDASFVSATTGAPVTTGAATVQLFEVQSDGTLKPFDFATNTVVANNATVTTPTLALTSQATGASPVAVGYWSAVLATVTGLTPGGIYIMTFSAPSGAAPYSPRKFQYGLAQGDLDASIASATSAATGANTAATAATTAVGALSTKVGTPANATVSADIAAVSTLATAASTSAGAAATAAALIQAEIVETQVAGVITSLSGTTAVVASPSQTPTAGGLAALVGKTATFLTSAGALRGNGVIQTATAVGGLTLGMASVPTGLVAGDSVAIVVI